MEQLQNRQELAKLFAEKGFKRGAEIGVCNGYYSREMCESNPQVFIYGVDSWAPKVSSHTRRNASGEAFATAQEVLAPYIGAGRYEIVRSTSVQAAKFFADQTLDFVYIDAGHLYHEVKEDIETWAPKVKLGGIVSGHDFYEFKSGRGGIIPAVNEYVQKHGYVLQLTKLDNENPDRDSRQPSWWFVKTH